jgi:hypothetical protein
MWDDPSAPPVAARALSVQKGQRPMSNPKTNVWVLDSPGCAKPKPQPKPQPYRLALANTSRTADSKCSSGRVS